VPILGWFSSPTGIGAGTAALFASPDWFEADGAGFVGAGVHIRATAIHKAVSTPVVIATPAGLLTTDCTASSTRTIMPLGTAAHICEMVFVAYYARKGGDNLTAW
jgi:hypothetical protein